MSSKLWTSSTRGRRYWFTNLEQTPVTGTIQTTNSRISPNKRPNITDGSKFDNWSRSPYATWVFNNTKEKWLTNWSSHEPDLWHLTNNNFPMTQMMTSAEVVSQQSFWGLPASPGRSDYPNRSINICSCEIINFFFNLFKRNSKRLLASAAVLEPRKNCALKSQWTSELLLPAKIFFTFLKLLVFLLFCVWVLSFLS